MSYNYKDHFLSKLSIFSLVRSSHSPSYSSLSLSEFLHGIRAKCSLRPLFPQSCSFSKMENQKQIILPVVLKVDNYLLWSRTTKTALRSRGLWEHIVGSQEVFIDKGKVVADEEAIESPVRSSTSEEDPKWIQEDQFVLAVLQSSLEQAILAAYSYVETTKELWDTLLGVYGNTSNISRIFEVKKTLNDLQQEEKSFKELFGDFRALWAELETLRPPTTNLKELNERREHDQVFGLLLTLNGSFKGLIHHILRFENYPP